MLGSSMLPCSVPISPILVGSGVVRHPVRPDSSRSSSPVQCTVHAPPSSPSSGRQWSSHRQVGGPVPGAQTQTPLSAPGVYSHTSPVRPCSLNPTLRQAVASASGSCPHPPAAVSTAASQRGWSVSGRDSFNAQWPSAYPPQSCVSHGLFPFPLMQKSLTFSSVQSPPTLSANP